MKRVIFCILVLNVLAACTGEAASSPTEIAAASPVPTQMETASPTPTATFTPTPSATPSPTYTPSPTFTNTPTVTPTPTPRGYYVNYGAAFSLLIPSGWEVSEEDSTRTVITDEDQFLSFYVYSEVAGDETGFEDQVDDFLTEIGSDGMLDGVDEVAIGGGVTAQRAKFTTSSEGVLIRFHLMYVRKEMRSYTFYTIGPSITFDDRLRVFEKLYESVKLLTGQIYGLDRDKTLVFMGSDPKPESLDPAISESSPSGYLGLIYSGLVWLSPELHIEPDLAERWTVNEDGTVYTFTLREGITFQSGRPITAEDVKYSLERAADPENNSPTAGTYLGDILGFKARMNDVAEEIEGVQVLDERTLTITLDGPKPYFLAKLSYTPSLVVDKEAVEASPDNWMFEPNASGPFKLRELIEEDAIIFERNEGYHSPAGVQYVVYLLYRPGPRISYYEAGDIDITGLGKTEALRVLEEDDPLHDQLSTTTALCSAMVKLNNSVPPMDDINVRKALALSIDRDHLLELFSENLDLRAVSILPPGMPGFSADLSADEFDPEAARAALAESAYANEEITLTMLEFGYGDQEDPFDNALIDMWREHLGIEVVIGFIDPLDFTLEARKTDAHLITYGWCADYPDPGLSKRGLN
jgi:ABC-type transport system substrate-binding protein